MSEFSNPRNAEHDSDFAQRLERLDEHLAQHVSGDRQHIPAGGNVADSDLGLEGVRDVLERINRVRRREADTDRRSLNDHQTAIVQSPPLDPAEIRREADSDFLDQRIGPYQIETVIARGGMGIVFRARDASLDRTVALKMLLSGPFASEEEKRRFQAEAEAAARLDHPGIVPIYDAGQHRGAPYFAMGLVEGGSLSERIRRYPLEPRIAAEWTVQIANAVGYAHRRGIIHRDIKPANVLLDRNDRPRLTDFGLARRIDRFSELTGTQQVLGTPGYMAPEQAAGDARSAGPLADVYSIGAVLYCMITARPPFQGSNPAETLKLVLEKDPIAPRQLNPLIPVDLNTICLKCLQKDPARRYQNADELKDDLSRFLRRVPIIARPIGPVERLAKWSRRHPVVAWLSLSVAISVVALIVGGVWYQMRLNRTLAELTSSRAETVDHLYRSLTGEADFLNKVRPLGYGPRVQRLIAEATQLDSSQKDPRRLRQLAVSGLGFVGAREPIEFPELDETIRSAKVLHESGHLIVGLENGALVSFDLKSRTRRNSLNVFDAPVIRIASEGRGGNGHTRLRVTSQFCRQIAHVKIDTDGRLTLQRLADPELPKDLLGLEVTPDGRYLIGAQPATPEMSQIQNWISPASLAVAHDVRAGRRTLCGDRQIRFSIVSLEDPAAPTRQLSAVVTPRFDIGEHHLVVGHSWLDDPAIDDSVLVCNHHSGEVEQRINTTCGALLNVRISPDGYFVAVGSQDGFEIFERNSGNRIARNDQLGACTIQSFVGGDGDVLVRTDHELLWFSPGHREPLARFADLGPHETIQQSTAGRYLVWTGTQTPRIVDVRGGDRLRIQAHSKTAKSVSFSSDGRVLISTTRYYGGNPSKVWNSRSGRLLFEFVGAESVFSPNGKWIASWSGGRLNLWEVATGTQIAAAAFDWFPATLRFSPQSDRVVIAGRFPGEFAVFELKSADLTDDGQDADAATVVLKPISSIPEAAAPVAFSPSGRRLAYAHGNQIKVQDLGQGTLTTTIDPQGNLKLDSLAFLSEDQLLVVTQKLQLWDLANGRRRWMSPDRYRTPLTVSPDRSHFLCRRKLVRASDFREVFELPAWLGPVASADWSVDGRRVAFGMDRGDVTVWHFDSLRASLRSQDVPWDSFEFSAATSDAAVSQMIEIGTRHADQLAPQQWNRRYDNLMTQMSRGATRPWILREVYWLAESLDRIASRPFFETASEETEMCNRLRNVQHLSRKLREQKEYAAERELLTSMQRAFEKVDTPSAERMRLASQIYHLIGDLHNFHLAEKETCLQAYKTEERILDELSEQSGGGQSLASFRFWLNRNSALAHHRYGDLSEARRRLHAAIAIAEKFPESIVDSQLIEKERVRLEQWKSETGSDDP